MDIVLFKDIVIIFGLSTAVNFLFTKIKLPTIIGYLLTGIVAGPYLFGVIESEHAIELMAEIGVVLLMFTIGLELSVRHLVRIRRVVFLGGFLQLLLTAFLIYISLRWTSLSRQSCLFIGFCVALSSTAIVLKLLQDRSEITTYYGRTVLGILIFQDLIVVPLILLAPILGGQSTDIGSDIMWLGVKSSLILAFVLVGHKWVMPWALHKIALTKNQELFLMAILLFCLSISMLTASIGMSLAFGAFLAGLMISESEYSHTAFGTLIPFRDTFTSFFFVSIGMMLNLSFVLENIWIVSAAVIGVIIIKAIVGGATSFLLGHSFVGTVTVGFALSQVGEFSFILAREGRKAGLIDSHYFQLFLGVAVVTMIISPFLIQSSHRIARFFLQFRLPQWWVDGLFPMAQAEIPEMKGHVVIIGKDARSKNLSRMVNHMGLPNIAIVYDPATVQERIKKGEKVVFGDATQMAILQSAYVQNAEIVVISVGDLIASMSIIDRVRHLNKFAHVIVRTKDVDDIEELYRLGANQVLPEKFETAIDLFEQMLKKMLVPKREIAKELAKVRDRHYGIFREADIKQNMSLPIDLPNIEVTSVRVDHRAPVCGKTLVQLMLRKKYDITIVAIQHGDHLIEHPEADSELHGGDIAYILGRPDKLENSLDLFIDSTLDTAD